MNTFEVGISFGVCLTNKMKTQISMGMNQLDQSQGSKCSGLFLNSGFRSCPSIESPHQNTELGRF